MELKIEKVIEFNDRKVTRKIELKYDKDEFEFDDLILLLHNCEIAEIKDIIETNNSINKN